MKNETDIIMSYDTETGTTMSETTITLYTYDELPEEARARVLEDFAEERQNKPYFGQWFADTTESEIWGVVTDLEQSITGARVQWRYNRWYSCDFDCEYSYNDCYDPGEVETVKDNGICYSMDICAAWNKHVRKLNAINARLEMIDELMNGKYNVWGPHYVYLKHKEHIYNLLDDLASDTVSAWYEELERACEDVRDAIETELRGEWDWYTSKEYAQTELEDEYTQGGEWRTVDHSGRVYYSDNRRWYTIDGELYEQSDVDHACVSIVKVA